MSTSASRDGLVIVDKPAGWTSHDVVGRLRRLAHTRKVGHAGTLDPMATGVLVVGVGAATRLLHHLVLADKAYTATVRLGQATVTDDAEGEIVASAPATHVTAMDVAAALAPLTGDILQVPSSVSAIKVDGQRSYARIRDGEQVELPARAVTVNRFVAVEFRRAGDLLDVDVAVECSSVSAIKVDGQRSYARIRDGEQVELPARAVTVNRFVAVEFRRAGDLLDVDVAVECSSGTYVRALARDLGAAIGTGGHLTALRRTRVGPFRLDTARTLDELADLAERDGDPITFPLADAVRAALPTRAVDENEARELSFGRTLVAAGIEGTYGAIGPSGVALALLRESEGRARPVLVFAAAG